MKEEYTRFFDDTENWALGCGGAFAAVLVPLIIAAAINTTVGFTLAFLVFLALLTVVLMLSMAPPSASFDADDTQVTFSYLGRKNTISYNDIKELKLERRNNESETRSGIQRCYVETLTIYAKEKTYVFSAQMDIDYDEVAKDPASMTAQFENSKFSRLKKYIEERIYINI